MTKNQKVKYQAAWDKLTATQQDEITKLTAACERATAAYEGASDAEQRAMDAQVKAYRAFEKRARAFKLPVPAEVCFA